MESPQTPNLFLKSLNTLSHKQPTQDQSSKRCPETPMIVSLCLLCLFQVVLKYD